MKTNYFISIGQNSVAQHNTIHDPCTKLKVKVTNLVKSQFKPRDGEVQYFVTSGSEKLAFETQGYNKHRNMLILQMIATYCVYLGLLDARFHSTLPY
jgi:putative NADPH-quinone reductase